MMRTLSTLLALTLGAATPAFAADQMPSPGTVVSDMASTAMGGMTMGTKASQKMQIAKSVDGEVMTSDLVGATVYNDQGDTIGQIADLAVANGKSIGGVVVSVGGFLGIGDSYVLVQPSSFAISKDKGTIKAYLNSTKDDLKNAPKFTYSKKGA